MREVFIISTGDIVKGRMAGTQRVLKIAKSLAAGKINVYICSLSYIKNDPIESIELFPGIYFLKSIGKDEKTTVHLRKFLRSVNNFMKGRNSDKIIYLYPTTFVLKDFIYLLYFKILKGYKFYCDINELRSSNVCATTPPAGFFSKIVFFLKSALKLISYKLSELQILFYDGIVVISTSLEQYFSRYTKKMIRVPILCDISDVKTNRKPELQFDNNIFKICFAGFISCKKESFDILFEALHRININRNVSLFLYGILIDEEKRRLNQLTEQFSLQERVFYMGNIDPDRLMDEFKKYHLLIIPRSLTPQTRYGFSTKLSEYLISGVPVLVTDVSDNAMYIKDNHNGYIIPPGSGKIMEEKILEIIENYNSNAYKIARNALSTAKEYFDYKLYTKKLIDLLFAH